MSFQACAQGISADGATSTTISHDHEGRINVDIAPANADGISHNTYTEFSVPAGGADLNNIGINAGIIVNEVTSLQRSTLTGPLEVQGRQAHVVLANPNGITVDGAQFINTGGVVLSGGRVRYDQQTGNPVINSGSSDITIEGKGLSGDLSTLQIIAGKIRVDGPIINHLTSPNANIELTAGNAEIVLDHRVSPNSSVHNLVKEKRVRVSKEEAVVIDITPRGSMTASRIKLAATNEGAGVRFAGKGLSSIGEFSIDANGKVGVNGGSIRAERSIKIKARDIAVRNTPKELGRIESIKGALTLISTDGDIDIRGSLTGAARNGADPDSKGGITLTSERNIKFESETADNTAVAFASDGDLALKAAGTVENHTGRLISNGNTIVTAASLENIFDMTEASITGNLSVSHKRGKRLWPSLWRQRKRSTIITADYGQPPLPGQDALITGRSVLINVDRLMNSGSILGRDGGAVVINADYIHNIAPMMGDFSFYKSCGLTCTSTGDSSVTVIGGTIASNEGLTINARQQLINERGKIMANGTLDITAPQVKAFAGFLPNVEKRPGGLDNAFTGAKANVFLEPTGGTFLSYGANVSITSETPVILFGGTVEGSTGTAFSAGKTDIEWARKDPHPIGLLRGLFP